MDKLLRSRDMHIVLLGPGHTHAHILREWMREPIAGCRLTCVSTHLVATYSGMLPGVLAGQYPASAMQIDLTALCARAGARLVVGTVTAIDVGRARLEFDDGSSLPFDVLSIGVGSVPSFAGVQVADGRNLVTVKPMQTFLERLRDRLLSSVEARRGAPVRLVTVGGGAAGVEVTLCCHPYVETLLGARARVERTLVTADDRVLTESTPGMQRRVERALVRAAVDVQPARRVVRVEGPLLTLSDRTTLEADVILWVTAAAPVPVLSLVDLPKDDQGFLLTATTLLSTSRAPIFAVGDAGTIDGARTPKAGVFAVRQGPVLWSNLGRVVTGRTLRAYTPQRRFLRLLNTGDGRAVGEWRGWSFEGVWVWRLKDAIDRSFVRRYA